MSRGGWCRHQAHKHSVELLGVQVYLDLNRLRVQFRFVFITPRQSVSISCSLVEVHPHIANLALCDQRWINPSRGRKFVPHDVGAGPKLGEMGQIMRERSAAGVDLFDHGWSQMGFDGKVRWRAENLFPG